MTDDYQPPEENLDRREAIQRVAMLLGASLAAPSIRVLTRATEAASNSAAWSPQALSATQLEQVATIAEHIIPRTDTPGARDAGVQRFVDDLLTDHYRAPERSRFLAGLQGVDVRARRSHKKSFVATTHAQQVAILTQMDKEAYPAQGAIAQQETKQQPPPRDPIVGPGSGGSGSLAQPTAADVDGATEEVRTELASGWFWRRLKEITLVGYYTSKPGATQELRVNPMGIWKGDMPYNAATDRAWA